MGEMQFLSLCRAPLTRTCSYVNGNHYDCIIDKERPSVGVGLGMPGLDHAATKAVETEVTQ